MNFSLFNEKFICKEKGDFSQTMEVALLAQKHLKSKKNTRGKNKKMCNYYKQLGHWAKIYKNNMFNALRKRKTKEKNVVDNKT